MKYFKNKETKKFLAFSMALAVVTSTMPAGMANAETTNSKQKLVTPTVNSYVEIATGAATTMTGEAVGVFAHVRGVDGVSASAVTISVAANKGYKITSGTSLGAEPLQVVETGRTWTETKTVNIDDKKGKKTVTITKSTLYDINGNGLYFSCHETSTIGEKKEYSWTYDDKAGYVLEYSAGWKDTNKNGKKDDLDYDWKDSKEEAKEEAKEYPWKYESEYDRKQKNKCFENKVIAGNPFSWNVLELAKDGSVSDNEKYKYNGEDYIYENSESLTVTSVTYAVKGGVKVTKDDRYHSTTSNNNGSVSTTAPTQAPTTAPTVAPTQAPTVAPTQAPTESVAPTASVAPTESAAPTVAPTKAPAKKTVKVGTKKTVNGGKYKVTKGNTVTYTAPSKKTAKVTIPATVKINGVTCKVTTIGKGAFKGNTKIKTVSLGKNIKKIEANAFKGCKNLKTITIKSTSLTKKNVAKTAFKGINKKATFKVPAKKVKAYKTVVKYAGAPKTVKVKK